MIEIKEELIESLLGKAVQKASFHNEVQLVSFTKSINEIDPIQFFEAGKKTNKNRIFWTNTAEEFYIAGIGNAYDMVAHESRFEVMEKKWSQILDEAIIHNPYKCAGTGILALGGMAFDPNGEKTNLWKNYKSSQFTIPEFTLIKNKHQYYFTITTKVKKTDHPVQLADELRKMESNLLLNFSKLPAGTSVKEKREIEPDKWMNSVLLAKEEIKRGQAKKIVLAREMRLKLDKPAEIGVLLTKLLATQTNSYVFAFEQGKDCFIGATPERLVKLKGKELLSTCLAGTAPRGKTAGEDIEISNTLFHDEKNRQEHDYVVKMIKSKIKDFCKDIIIPDEPIVYPLKNVHHLYTPVTATLKNGISIFDIIQQLHPTPALGGVPRDKSLEFIRKHEIMDRGWYGAPVGWLDSNQNSEFAVAIRSGLIQGNKASLFAGCGVMKDSDVKKEYEETNIKFLPMLTALGVNE